MYGCAPLIDAAYMRGNRANSGSTFTCPEMVNVEGMRDGQTGTDPNNPKGGVDRIIRVGYWINASNPIGAPAHVVNDVFTLRRWGTVPAAMASPFVRRKRQRDCRTQDVSRSSARLRERKLLDCASSAGESVFMRSAWDTKAQVLRKAESSIDANCANLRERTALPAFAIIRGIRVALFVGLILTRAGRAIG
jgi:hypothetical protein